MCIVIIGNMLFDFSFLSLSYLLLLTSDRAFTKRYSKTKILTDDSHRHFSKINKTPVLTKILFTLSKMPPQISHLVPNKTNIHGRTKTQVENFPASSVFRGTNLTNLVLFIAFNRKNQPETTWSKNLVRSAEDPPNHSTQKLRKKWAKLSFRCRRKFN